MQSDRVARAFAAASLGLIAGTALAHVFEMPHKLAMAGDTWLPIQSELYNGWGSKLLYLDIIAVVSLLYLGVKSKNKCVLALTALIILLIADVGVFLIWIRPTNIALDAWTQSVPMNNWTTLRSNWEWGHAVRFVLLTIATALAALTRLPSEKTTGC